MLWDSGAASEYEWLESFDDKEHDPSHEEEEDINCAVPRESDLGSSRFVSEVVRRSGLLTLLLSGDP